MTDSGRATCRKTPRYVSGRICLRFFLGYFFTGGENRFWRRQKLDAFAGLENVYNHGNQPSLHIAWLFNYAGRPELTQHWVRRICDVFYGNDPIHGYGYGQDEDQGQLGAWYVLAGLGLFDVQGGTCANPAMQVSLPMFDSISVKLDKKYFTGETLAIHVAGGTDASRHIKTIQWNGEKMNGWSIPWRTLTKGGTLEIETAPAP
jgi:putative alpha-1,2-mannosidase